MASHRGNRQEQNWNIRQDTEGYFEGLYNCTKPSIKRDWRRRMSLCYSTDPIGMAKIKDARPKYHLSKEQKMNRAIEGVRRTSTKYSSRVQEQISKSTGLKIREGLIKKIKINNSRREK